MTLSQVDVPLGDRSYTIHLGVGLIDRPDILAPLVSGRDVAVVTNDTVAPLYAARVRQALAGASASRVIDVVLPDGEAYKDWRTLNSIFDALLEHRFDRSSVLVALGGGVVGDMTGFAAAVYQRGIDFIQIPTTLLAQVDSSVGGKTGINHPLGKNMVGAFHQPRVVIADVGVLGSLPPREISAGLAEIIKHGAIADVDYLARVESSIDALRRCDPDALVEAVAGSCRIKAGVVARDERESGVRAILNFGHTFGHAIEAGMGYGQWLHGEAVGCGMVMAADLSVRLGLLAPSDQARLVASIVRAGLPVRGPAWSPERYVDLMSVDKKAQRGTPRFVLLEGMGQAVVQRAPDDALTETLRACTA